jgi:hypothetical protein
MLYGDVGVMESLNSILKLQTARSPHMALDLLDARVKLKKQLGASATKKIRQEGKAGLITKCLSHEELLQRAAALVGEAEQFYDQSSDIPLNLERWSSPAPLPNLPDSETIRKATPSLNVPSIVRPQSKRSSLFGAAYALVWNRGCHEEDLKHGISFGDSQSVIWLCTQKYEKTMGVFVRAVLNGNGSVSIPTPLEHKLALELFTDKYQSITSEVGLAVYNVDLDWSHPCSSLPYVVASDTAPSPLFTILQGGVSRALASGGTTTAASRGESRREHVRSRKPLGDADLARLASKCADIIAAGADIDEEMLLETGVGDLLDAMEEDAMEGLAANAKCGFIVGVIQLPRHSIRKTKLKSCVFI